MSSLYEMSNAFEALFERLEYLTEQAEQAEENSVSKEEVEQAWFDTLDAIEEEFSIKAENIALYIKELTAKSDAIKQEERRLAERRRAFEHRAIFLKSYLLESMQKMHLKKVDGIRARVTVRNNPDSLKIDDEQVLIKYLVDSGFCSYLRYPEPELRKADIKQLLKSGVQLQGCKLAPSQSILIK